MSKETRKQIEREMTNEILEERREFLSNIDELDEKELLKVICMLLFDATAIRRFDK